MYRKTNLAYHHLQFVQGVHSAREKGIGLLEGDQATYERLQCITAMILHG